MRMNITIPKCISVLDARYWRAIEKIVIWGRACYEAGKAAWDYTTLREDLKEHGFEHATAADLEELKEYLEDLEQIAEGGKSHAE